MLIDGIIVTQKGKETLYPGPRGVRKHLPHKCYRGFTLFSSAFGNFQYLIDMNGMVVQTWPARHTQYAEILPNGNLMADNHGAYLQEIDPKGKQVWKWECGCHHDFHVVDDDHYVSLIKDPNDSLIPGFFPDGFNPPNGLASDVVAAVNRKCEPTWQFAFRDHVHELHDLVGLPRPVVYGDYGPKGNVRVIGGLRDYTHTNTIEVLPDTPLGRKDDRFRAGNILFSFRALDIIGIADLDKNKIVWAWGLGKIDGQHQPTMLPDGNILLFDNGTARGWSAVIEINPATGEEVWRYEDRAHFFSAYRSGAQRLPNGNTLIAESDAARIFEVTPQGEVVWDFHSPFLDTPGGGSQGFHVYRATRYSEEEVAPVFEARQDESVLIINDERRAPIKTYPELMWYLRDGLGG
jgi:hypothetical protein